MVAKCYNLQSFEEIKLSFYICQKLLPLAFGIRRLKIYKMELGLAGSYSGTDRAIQCRKKKKILLPLLCSSFSGQAGEATTQQLPEELYRRKKQSQIFDLVDYAAGVSSDLHT